MARRVAGTAAVLLAAACSGEPVADVPSGPSVPADTRADLVPAGIDAPATAIAGDLFTMHVGVRNAGALDVGPGWIVRVYLSADATITPSDTLIDEFVTSRDLNAGQSDSYLRNKKLSALLPAGTYFLGSIIDATGVVDESRETNNVMAGPPSVSLSAAPTTQ